MRLITYIMPPKGAKPIPARKVYKKARFKRWMARHHTYFKEKRDRKCKKTL